MKSKSERILFIIFHVFISLSIYATSCEILKQVFYSVYSGFYFISGIIWSIFSYIVVMASHVLLCWGIVGKLPKKINEIDYLYVSIFTGIAIFIFSFFWFTDIYDLMLQFMTICTMISINYDDKKNETIDKKASDDAEIVVEDVTAVEEDKTITDDVVVEEELDNGDLEVEEEIVKEMGVELLEEPDVAVCDIEEEQEIEQMSEEVVTKKSKFNMKKFLLWTIPSLIIIGVSVWLTIIACAEAPEYVVSYKDKFLWYYDMPNNSLCNDYLEQAKQANLKGLEELEKELYVKAELAKPSNLEYLKNIADYYNSKDDNQKVIDILSEVVKKEKELNATTLVKLSHAYYDLYLDDKYKRAEKEKAKLYAEKALMIDDTNESGLWFFCRMYVNDGKYKEALEWLDKFIDNYPDVPKALFVKSVCYYHIGDKYYAAELYKQACAMDPSHEYVKMLEYLGGKPFDILSVAVGNTDYDGDIITSYGGRIVSYNTQYLKPKLKIKGKRTGVFTIYVKLYRNGNLSTGTSSPDGYSFSREVYCTKDKEEYIVLSGWGSSSSGNWSEGNYRFEFWYGDEKIGQKSFKVYWY